MADASGQLHSHLTPVNSSSELVSQINPIPIPASDGNDQLSLSFQLGSRAIGTCGHTTPFPIGNASRQGRPITGTAANPYPGSQTVSGDPKFGDMLAASEANRLASNITASQMNFDCGNDIFSIASMDNVLNSQAPSANAIQVGSDFSSPKSFATNGSPFSFSGNLFPNPQAITSQFQNMSASFNNSKQPLSMPSGAAFFPNQQGAFANSGAQNFYPGGMTSNGRQDNGFYPNHGAAPNMAPGFNSQDFTMPPPSQPWQGFPTPNTDMQKVTCDGCQKVFKWPHILDCLHVYCFPCMVKRFETATHSITCQKCNHITAVPDGPCALKLDYQVCGEIVKMKMSPFTCTLCTREQEAASCCTVCSAFLCIECHDRHKIMLHFQGHTIKPITKIAMHNGEYKPMCGKHPSVPEDKYCVTCEKMICEECITDHVHPNMPAGNNYDLGEAFNIVAPRLQTWNEDAFIKYSDVVDMIKRFPDLQANMDMKKRHVRRLIEEYSDYIKNVVEQCRASAMEEVEQAHHQMEVKVQSLVKTYSDLATGLEGMSKFNSRTLDDGNIAHVMKNLDAMENTYKRLIQMYSETLKSGDGINVDFKFNPNYPNTNEILHENFLNISYRVNDIEYKVMPTSQMSRSDSRTRNFMDYAGGNDNPDCNYQRWSAATESMSISTWNNTSERDRKSGTFIPNINRCRTRTSYIHVFGEYGRGDYAFTEPSGQAYLRDGSYVICDTNNHRIVYYSANHEFIRSIGQPPNLPPLADDQDHRNGGLRNKGFNRQEGYLYFPNRVAICPITQNIVATERPPSHDIQIFTVDGEFKRCFGGNILQHPRGVTVDEHGTIIVVECKVMKLVMFDQEGTFLVSHSLTKDLEFPNDVAAKGDRIYISDNRGHCVQVFSYEAEFIMKIGFESVTYFPIGVSINFMNQLVVTDNHNTFNITVFDLNGKVMHIFESITKHAQCHNVAVHPSSLELMLTTKDCNVYFFNYDPNAQHPPPTSNVPRSIGHSFNGRRGRGNSNGNGNGSSFY